MYAFQRPGRAAAVLGAVVAVSATTLIGVVAGTAAAEEPGLCTDNVNVREEPSLDAPIVALCEEGTAVLVGESRNGFVELTDLGGWAAEEFVAVDETPAFSPGGPSTPADDDDATAPRGGVGTTPGEEPADDPTDRSGGEPPTDNPFEPQPVPEPDEDEDEDEPDLRTQPEPADPGTGSGGSVLPGGVI